MSVTTPRAPAVRPAVAIAGVASIAAGLVHGAAAANHEGDAALVWMFVLCAVAQVVWGVAAIVAIRPSRVLLFAGLVINGGALLVWGLSRTTGIPFISALSEVEEVGRQDLGAALFAGVSVAAMLAVLLRPQRAPRLAFGWVGGLAVVALLAALPAMAAEHAHEHSGGDGHEHVEAAGGEHGDHAHDPGDEEAGGAHGHEDGETHDDEHGEAHSDDGAHASGEHAAGDHAHGALASAGGHGHPGAPGGEGHAHDPDDPGAPHQHPTDPDDPHEHPTDPDDPHEHPTDPDDPDDPHEHPTDPDDPITSVDDPRLTAEQFDIAIQLMLGTQSGMTGFVTEADVLAAGYRSIGDGGAPGQYTHYINWAFVDDGFELDPGHIESIVMKMNADGTTRVVAGMYLLSWGDTMADAPPLAGELTTWHDHDDLCFEAGAFVARAADGVCPVGVLGDTPPMLHVWIEANPCGNFAIIDEHGEDCGATHSH
jgi:hypothetical protein